MTGRTRFTSDFVIKALNQDTPYNQFVRWQLAGDEIEPQNPLAMMATGFLGAGVFPRKSLPMKWSGAAMTPSTTWPRPPATPCSASPSAALLPRPQVRSHSAGRLLPLRLDVHDDRPQQPGHQHGPRRICGQGGLGQEHAPLTCSCEV